MDSRQVQVQENTRAYSQPPRDRRYYDDDVRTQIVSYSELDRIRDRQRGLMVRRSSDDFQEQKQLSVYNPGRGRDTDYVYDKQRTRYDDRGGRRDYYNSDDYAVARYNDDRAVYDNRKVVYESEDYESDDSRERRRHRRHKSKSHKRDKNGSNSGGDNDDRCWYSEEKRKDAGFFSKHFDTSYDGIGAAVAGALIGGMTARRFGNEQHRKSKMAAGAVVGAAGFNAAENWFRMYTEDGSAKDQKQEKAWEQKWHKGSTTGKDKYTDDF